MFDNGWALWLLMLVALALGGMAHSYWKKSRSEPEKRQASRRAAERLMGPARSPRAPQ